MTHASYWTASDGTQLHYRYDDFTDPWQEAPLVVLLHPGLGSSLRRAHPIGTGSAFAEMEKRMPQAERVVCESARRNVFDYLPERCVADALAFLRKHFPEEGR